MSSLPSVYQSNPCIYYVYFHRDPITNEVVYVGKGSRGRAWHCAETNSRSLEHSKWMNDLIYKGYTPNDWVEIVETQLDNNQALELETNLIWGSLTFPKFNSKKNYACKLSKDILLKIQRLRKENASYDSIAKIVGFSTMTIYRALNGQTKNYK